MELGGTGAGVRGAGIVIRGVYWCGWGFKGEFLYLLYHRI